MTGQCCDLHTNTCGQLDYCCDKCPADRESDAQLYAAALTGVLLLVALALGLA